MNEMNMPAKNWGNKSKGKKTIVTKFNTYLFKCKNVKLSNKT